MAKKPVVMIDINILMDVLQKREPFYGTSAGLLAAVETGQVQGWVAAHSLTRLFYLVQKGRSSAEARVTITNLLQFINIAPVDQSTIEQALNLEIRDFEDAVQMVSAMQCKADFLITRNVKDFQPALLPVLTPVDFLGTL
jgi:predicted nucleic acid-binding protein